MTGHYHLFENQWSLIRKWNVCDTKGKPLPKNLSFKFQNKFHFFCMKVVPHIPIVVLDMTVIGGKRFHIRSLRDHSHSTYAIFFLRHLHLHPQHTQKCMEKQFRNA